MAVLALLASHIHSWAVMTDEMQYAKLATHIGETLSPWAALRGVRVSTYTQVYPALLAPFYGTLSAPEAFWAAHVLNGAVFATATIPAYLLAREARLPRSWAIFVTVMSVALPWSVLAGFVLSESAAYPIFLWAFLAVVRAVEAPSIPRDAVALATLTRTQFLALGVALVVAALLYKRRGHELLVVASAAAIAGAIVGGSRILGNYAITTNRWPLPWRAFLYAGAHIDEVGLGIGLVPLIIGGAWLISRARRDPFALTALVTVVVLTLEVSSFDVRFGASLVRDRYLFYVAPLLLIAMSRALREQPFPALALAGMAWFVAATGLVWAYPGFGGHIWIDSPAGVLHDLIQSLRGPGFVGVVAVLTAMVLIRLKSHARAISIAVVAFVGVATVSTAAVAWSWALEQVPARPAHADWIDRALPKNATAAMIPYPGNAGWNQSSNFWWGTEFWNSAVDQAYRVGEQWDYTPFPSAELRVDPSTGRIRSVATELPYVVAATSDGRLGLAGRRVAARNGLEVIRAVRPYRATWVSRGLDPDGWTRPHREAVIRTFGGTRVAVLLRGVRGRAVRRCGSGTFTLPRKRTGVVRGIPFGPATKGRRAVGMRVVRVRVVRSCLDSAA